MPARPQELETALAHHQAGRLHPAREIYEAFLRLHPQHVDALQSLGVVLRHMGRFAESIEKLRRAADLAPESTAILTDLAKTHLSAGQNDQAAALCAAVLERMPDDLTANFYLGLARYGQAKLSESELSFDRAVQIKPDHAESHINLANVRYAQGKIQEAIWGYLRAAELAPLRADIYFNLGGALRKQGKFDEARACLDRALQLNSDYAHAHKRRGDILSDQGNYVEALAGYQRALELAPGDAATHYAAGVALRRGGDIQAAVSSFQRSLELQPNQSEAWNSLGNALADQGRLDESIACYEQALRLKPDHDAALNALVHQSMQCCRWTGLEDYADRLMKRVEAGSGEVAPFNLLSLPTTSAQQLQCAEHRIRYRVQSLGDVAPVTSFSFDRAPRPRIKLGYLSADFRRHPISYLIAELIEQHDRRQFEVVAYSFGHDDQSATRARMVSAFDEFVDIRSLSHSDAAGRIHADQCDILIDLMGHTRDSRLEILSLRPAPIQVSYLGYPGTTGAKFIDYVLVDAFTVPASQQPFFTERLVHLPNCYLPHDARCQIAEETPSRADCNLPAQGFVFCSFNNSYKITPPVFDIWMDLLREIPESALWLASGNTWMSDNLRHEAERRGVDGRRLVFAQRLPHLADHLARYRLADLFLDSYPYNAHSTASDALSAGCLVVTMAGETFASRVAGSLLHSLNLPDLVTSSLSEYRRVAMELAQSDQRRCELRARLANNGGRTGLIDGARMARNIEDVYRRMWQIYATGQSPQAFSVQT